MDSLLISGIQHFVFCRRQWALIHIEQQWKDNFLTTHGKYLHEKTDDPEVHYKRKDVITLHAMRVRSERLKIEGVCDTVELQKTEAGVYFPRWKGKYSVYPIEYKRGKPKVIRSDILQLLAQAVCLEEMTAVTIEEGSIFYFQTRRRERVLFTQELRQELEEIIKEMHSLMQKRYTPKVKRQPKCRSCSLRDICLPELGNRQSASLYIERMLLENDN
jgi:CRISPR-associated exonuclease Cas4